MAKGPRYKRPLRRRFDGKTNYHRRLNLIKSRKLRVVIRASTKHIRVQIVESSVGGDKVLVSAFSKELTTKYDWKANTGNVPAAYLTGYLAGLRAKQKNISEAILDLGVFYHRNRVLAAFKGVLLAGLEVPHRDEFFPEGMEDYVKGSHIESYAGLLKKDDPEKYNQLFSDYIKNKVNPLKISQDISNTVKRIESKI